MIGILDRTYNRVSARLVRAGTEDVLVILAVIMLALSSVISWFATPLQGDIRGFAFPLTGGVQLSDGLLNRFHLLSFGSASFLLAACSFLVHRLKAPKKLLLILGAAAVLQAAYFFGHLFLVRPGLIESAMAQHSEAVNMASFSTAYMGGNSAVDPGWEDLATDSLSGRMGAAYFLTGFSEVGIGWWWAMISGLMLLWAAADRRDRRTAFREWGMIFVVVLAVMAGIGWKAVRGEQHRLRGDRLLEAGHYSASIGQYRKAVHWHPYLDENPKFVHNLGMAYYLSGQTQEPEANVFLGDNHAGRMEPLDALHEYQKALSIHPGSGIIRKKLGDLFVSLGLSDYGAKNAHSAVARWQEALEVDPGRIDAHLFLGHAYFHVNRDNQDAAIRENGLALDQLANKLFVSDVLNNLGDCYYKNGDFLRARTMYMHSLKEFKLVKKVINFNAQIGLQGL